MRLFVAIYISWQSVNQICGDGAGQVQGKENGAIAIVSFGLCL